MGGTSRAVAAAAAALALAGCGLLPGPAPAGGGATAAVAHERPTPPGAPPRITAGASSPAAAVRSFASTYINWTAADVANRLGGLARDSVGQARSELELESQETRRDGELHAGGVGNAGVVEAVSRLPGARLRYLVVTREQTTASHTRAYLGLAPAWHVALATVDRVRGAARGWGWAVSRWQPES